ncbi:MAG: carbohydrate ABC transporter permease [Oscillospiraceae bacterium]|nr:carbohydrate ABC transporter permease [Oscillospiraceae bacterium]
MNKTEQAPTVVKRESKNRIRVDFERTSLLKRLQVKYISMFFLQRVIWVLFRLVLLIGISYVVIFPFFAKVSGSFMSPEDFIDSTVRMIPRAPTINTYNAIYVENDYVQALINTSILSLVAAVIQMFVCTFIGYGLSKFKFRGNSLVFIVVLFTLLIPHQTLQFSLFMKFRYFDFLGIVEFINKAMGATKDLTFNFINSEWYAPLIFLSVTGLAFKNGLYILVMRQFFKGVPDELEEAAYVDGAGVFRTYFTIILPNAIPMMVTIFLFAFTWQWTDEFYVQLFTTETGPYLMPRIVKIPRSLITNNAAATAAGTMYTAAIRSTCGLMIIAPLIVVYLIGQRFLIQGIERTGVVG